MTNKTIFNYILKYERKNNSSSFSMALYQQTNDDIPHILPILDESHIFNIYFPIFLLHITSQQCRRISFS